MEVKRRESWEIEETRYLLNLIREKQIMKCLDNKKFRADEIFKCLEQSMHEKGYKKNWKQMQTRFKTLRQQYNAIKRKMVKSGSGNYLSSFPYATEMSDLLDSRPIAIAESIDSCVSEDSNNIENPCVSEDLSSINERDDANNHIYEDAPDPRDGSIPGCSKHVHEPTIVTQYSQSNRMLSTIEIDNSSTDSSSSNKTHVKRRKYQSRSYESIIMRCADKMKETYEKTEENVMVQTKECVSKLIESEKEIMEKMLDNYKIILKETTNQLLHGLQNIFGVATSTRTMNASQMVPSIVPSFNEIPSYLYLNELQHFQSSVTLSKVLINLKRPVNENEELQRVKIQRLNNYSNINDQKGQTDTRDITDSNEKIQ